MTIINKYLGLSQGIPFPKAASVINANFEAQDETLLIGDAVFVTPSDIGILPNVNFINSSAESLLFYGILIGGVRKGIYPDNNNSDSFVEIISDLLDTLIARPGESVRVCTQGVCIARINPDAEIQISDPLTSVDFGDLTLAFPGENVIARALQPVTINQAPGSFVYILVDVQREGILS